MQLFNHYECCCVFALFLFTPFCLCPIHYFLHCFERQLFSMAARFISLLFQVEELEKEVEVLKDTGVLL